MMKASLVKIARVGQFQPLIQIFITNRAQPGKVVELQRIVRRLGKQLMLVRISRRKKSLCFVEMAVGLQHRHGIEGDVRVIRLQRRDRQRLVDARASSPRRWAASMA